MKMNKIIISSRASKLAVWQTNYIADQLRKKIKNIELEILKLNTLGDIRLDTELSKIGGKGLFLKELEESLIKKQSDISVHSLKDVPVVLADGFKIIANSVRDDPRDVLISNKIVNSNDKLRIGTSSLRRQYQLAKFYPDAKFIPIRGNIHTRIAKLNSGEFDAIVLAFAAIRRMSLEKMVTRIFELEECVPAPGQGIISVEAFKPSSSFEKEISIINDKDSTLCSQLERNIGRLVSADCTMPIGCNVSINNTKQKIQILFYIADVSGSKDISIKKDYKIDTPLQRILMDFKDILEENHIHKIINTFK